MNRIVLRNKGRVGYKLTMKDGTKDSSFYCGLYLNLVFVILVILFHFFFLVLGMGGRVFPSFDHLCWVLC
jgi:hypothetical protein